MSSPAVMPRCVRCGASTQPGAPCSTCGFLQGQSTSTPFPEQQYPGQYPGQQHSGQYPMPYQAPYSAPIVVQAPKSGGIAVLLNFIVLGGGHLYLNKVGIGIALICWDVFLFLLLLIPLIGWVAAPLLWLVSFAITSAVVVSEANAQNRVMFGQGGYR